MVISTLYTNSYCITILCTTNYMTHDSRARTIDPYATTTKTLTDSSYYNHKLAKKLIILKTKR